MIPSTSCDLRYSTFEELAVKNTATASDWLSKAELALMNRFRSSVRRHTFLAGRIMAKRLLQEQHSAASACAPRRINIQSNSEGSTGIRPRVTLAGRRMAYSLSISHTFDSVIVAGINRFGASVGVDLVRTRNLGPAFERSWLTDAESALLGENRDELTVADIWAMKEAVYKACNRGEPFAPRKVEVLITGEGTAVRYHGRHLKDRCSVRVWRLGEDVAAVATYQRLHLRNGKATETQAPISLNGHSHTHTFSSP